MNIAALTPLGAISHSTVRAELMECTPFNFRVADVCAGYLPYTYELDRTVHAPEMRTSNSGTTVVKVSSSPDVSGICGLEPLTEAGVYEVEFTIKKKGPSGSDWVRVGLVRDDYVPLIHLWDSNARGNKGQYVYSTYGFFCGDGVNTNYEPDSYTPGDKIGMRLTIPPLSYVNKDASAAASNNSLPASSPPLSPSNSTSSPQPSPSDSSEPITADFWQNGRHCVHMILPRFSSSNNPHTYRLFVGMDYEADHVIINYLR